MAALAPDVILAFGASTVGPLLQATRTVPIVFPVVGDPVYGRPRYDRVKDPALKKALAEFPRQALHAYRLAFTHPGDGRPLQFEAPLPVDMRELITKLGMSS